MDRVDESVCCQEITEMLSLNEEAVTIDKLKEPLTCVTDNPAFAAVCLNLSTKEADMSHIGNLHDWVGVFLGDM